MTILERPNSTLPGKLRGLHLFHYGAAPCAQRVRFVLAEKGVRRAADVPWRSDAAQHLEAPPGSYIGRPVSLLRRENLTADYAAIHPHLVVPALVHDGVLHIESVDIMNYVNGTLPGPLLVPEGQAGQLCSSLVKRASELQTSVRYVTYRWSLGGLAKLNPEKQEELRRLDAPDSPEQLAEFYRRFSNDEISEATYADHVARLEDGFGEVEELLKEDSRSWLSGDDFSMADIIWSVKMLRISDAGYPFEIKFPRLKNWFDRVRERPTFEEAIGRDMRVAGPASRAKAAVQNFFGRGLRRLASE